MRVEAVWPGSLKGPFEQLSQAVEWLNAWFVPDRSNYSGKLSLLVDHDEMAAIGDLVFWDRRQVDEDIRVGTMLAVDIGRRNQKLMEDP